MNGLSTPNSSNSISQTNSQLTSFKSDSPQNGQSNFQPSLSSEREKGQICCLVDSEVRCYRTAGNASYSKRVEKTVLQRRLKLRLELNVNHIYICDYHKNVIHNMRMKRKHKESDERDENDQPETAFAQMQVNTLRRYKRHFKLQTRPGLNKAQLSDMVVRHFRTLPVQEKETLTYFIYMAKNHKSRFDSKLQLPNQSVGLD